MDKDKLIENLKELKKFSEDNPEVFKELTGGIQMLFNSITREEPETVAQGLDAAAQLTRAENLLDEDLALRRKGAKVISETVNFIKELILEQLV